MAAATVVSLVKAVVPRTWGPQGPIPGLENPDYSLTVAGEIWNSLADYEDRLSKGWDKLRALELKGQWNEAMYNYWLSVECNYKIIAIALDLEILSYRHRKTPYYKSLAEVKMLLAPEN